MGDQHDVRPIAVGEFDAIMKGLRVWRRGPGATHLLIHGFAGGGESWTHVAARMSGAVVTATLPGHAGGPPVRDGGMNGYIEWLREVVLTTQPSHIAGYSAGGRVVAAAIAAGLSVPASLISASLAVASAEERRLRSVADARWSTLLRTMGIDAFVEAWEAQPIFASQSAATVALQRPLRLSHDPIALAEAMDALSVARMADVSRALRGAPVQLVVGALDRTYVALARASGLDVVVVPQAGHNLLAEAPEALARALEEFVGA